MFNKILPELTAMNIILIIGIVWLSGVFIWLTRKFVASYEGNTQTMTEVRDTLRGVDKKLDTAAERDVEIVRTLAAIHARQSPARVDLVNKPEQK